MVCKDGDFLGLMVWIKLFKLSEDLINEKEVSDEEVEFFFEVWCSCVNLWFLWFLLI